MKYNKFRIIAVLFLCIILWSNVANVTTFAKEEQTVIRVGYMDYDGFIEQQQDGTFTGYAVDYLNQISKITGWKIEYVYDSWSNLLDRLNNHEIDYVCSAQYSEQRDEIYDFSAQPIGIIQATLYTNEDNDNLYYEDFEYLNDCNIGVLRNSKNTILLQDYAEKNGFLYHLKEYETEKEMTEALSNGEIDAFAGEHIARHDNMKLVGIYGSDSFYMMTYEDNELQNELNYAISTIKGANPNIETELYQKYYNDGNPILKPSFTRAEQELINKANTIKVALLPNRNPISYMNQNGEACGIVRDMLDQIAKKSGLKFEYTFTSTGQLNVDYLNKNPDVLIAGVMTQNSEFQKDAYVLSKSFYKSDIVCVGRNDFSYNHDNTSDLIVAIPSTYISLNDYLLDHYPYVHIETFPSTIDCIKAVQDGNADLLAQNINIINPILTNPHYENLRVLPISSSLEEDLSVVGNHSEDNELIIGIMNKCIDSFSDSEIDRITLSNTVNNTYHLTVGDFIYKFRISLSIIAILIIFLLALMVIWSKYRKQYTDNIQNKNRQLMTAVAQANNAYNAKSQFLSRMSHEIRTPMNAIVGATELMKNHIEEPDKISEYMNQVTTASDILLNLINDVLDLSAIEKNKLKIANEPFDLYQVMESVWTIYESQFYIKGIQSHLNMDKDVPFLLRGDALRVKQILLNLISNAYKFTSEGGKIDVNVNVVSQNEKNVYVRISVSDTGCGMSEELKQRLFQPFEQNDATTAFQYGGSGLGLSITKNLVNLLHGAIKVDSTLGSGTTFTLDLPFERTSQAQTQTQLGEQDTSKQIDRQNQPDQPDQPDHPDQPNQKNQQKIDYDLSGLHILLADDNEINRDIAEELLNLTGALVKSVENGEMALEEFTSSEVGTYDVILMDIHMPIMNGYQATQEIRKSSHTQAKSIPIYAMSANAYNEHISKCLSAGMNGCIQKPIDTQLLYQTLQKCMKE